MLTAALFPAAKIQKQPECPLTYRCLIKMWLISTMEYYSALKKEGNSAICDNIEETWGHYAKMT